MWSMVAQRLTQITPLAATPDQLWQRVEAAWSAVSQEHIQNVFESMPRRVSAGSANTQTGSHNGQRSAGTPLAIGEAWLKRILSLRPVSTEWVYRTKAGVPLFRKVTNSVRRERCQLIMEPVHYSNIRGPCMSKNAVNITFLPDC
ncbi:transposable element Tcb1 transposase [Trichonephila clavipes]|nr:transposable element Tcb1 transposase [Trichonephila clavipes]